MAENSIDRLSIEKEILKIGKERQEDLKKQGFFTNALLSTTRDYATAAATLTEEGKIQGEISDTFLDNTLKSLKASEKQTEAIQRSFPGLVSMAEKSDDIAKSVDAFLPGFAKFGGIAVGAVLAFIKIQKAITDTRKELGVSALEAAKITAQNKVLAQVAKGYGLELDDITSAQAAIRNDLGASVQESINLSLNFARTAAATGQTSDELTSTLSIMESISGASRDVLLNQIRTNAAIIGQAGVSPALVMKDLASNAEFFAQFAKDGGGNIIQAGIAARKLGLEMSAVAGISESLLNFESSIESQLSASLLLGRQINLDKARQLALVGDQEGVMKEILKAVGGEAEFNKMNVIQRKALAESVGVNVEQLSRLVRNNTAGGTAGAVGAAVAGASNTFSDPEQHRLTNKLIRVME